MKKDLGLTEDQVKRLDGLYQDRTKHMKTLADAYDKEWMALDRMTSERVVDESVYNVQMVREESLRFELSKSRLMMLYKMDRELTPDQYKKLPDILNKYRPDSSRGRTSGPGR